MTERRRVALTLEQAWHRVPGGTARAAIETTRALSEGHPDLDLIGVAARHRRAAPAPFTPSIPVRHLSLPRRALYDSWHRLRRPAVERATGRVEVIHATGVAMPPPTVPIVWTLHDLAWRRDPSTFTPRGVRFFEAALDLARRDASLVLCSSQATLDDARDAGLPVDRLRLVPLGVRKIAMIDRAEAAVAVNRRHGLVRYVLFVGTAEPRKNLAGLVSAMRLLDRADVDLVLAGNPGWGRSIEEVIAPLGRRARSLGFVSDAELAELYAGAAAFAYPSRWEGFGLPVLEALAAGAPVVTSIGTACAEVAGDAALLVEPEDAAGIADALGRLLDDETLAAGLRTAGPVRAAGFTWERTAALTADAYREVADQ